MKIFKLSLLSTFSVVTLLFAITSAAQEWPDKSISQPSNFRAFYLSEGNSCNVEIVFERSIQDGKYDYYTFGQFPSSGWVLLDQTVVQDDKIQPFTVVNATADGQRHAYDMNNDKTLLPFKITTCHIPGVSGIPSNYVIKAYQKGQDPTSSKPFWTSDPFNVIDNQIAPQGSGLTSLKATPSGKNQIKITWDTDNKNVKAYFIIIGRQFIDQFITAYITDPNTKQTTINVPDDPKSYAVSMNLMDTNGAVVNPTSCFEVLVQ